MEQKIHSILIVEDEENIRELVAYALKSSGFLPLSAESGKEAFTILEERHPSLILLDIMLPGEDGLAILRKLRQTPATADIPVILLTAKTSEYDKVKGLDAGADDYLAKPFGVMELISRIRAVLRRSHPAQQVTTLLSAGAVSLDVEKHTVLSDGQPIQLTFKEFELLQYLLQNKGIVLSRDRIMDRVWGFDFEGESRTVDMHIKTLRQKLRDGGSIIETVRGVGYKVEV